VSSASAARRPEYLFTPGGRTNPGKPRLPAGIEPSDDPVLMIRPAACAVSFGQRAQ